LEDLIQKKKLKDRLKQHFRLVILNDDTLEEVSTYKLNLINIYLMISSLFVIAGLAVASIIIFTPIRTFIPGYGDIEANHEFLELQQKTKSLENEIAALTEYIDRSINRLNGDPIEVEENIGSSSEMVYTIPTDFEEDSEENIINMPRKKISKAKLGQYYLLPPMNGPISSSFDPKIKHYGVDILGPKNTAVKAIMDGYVISSDWTLESGNTIAIQHSNNIVSFYKHNSSLLKKAGSFVQAGEAIAIIGNSGTLSDGPHLHFELWYNGLPVNPMEFINF
jgi:murein DD-endopeptidase MepM/ murein hydrolase activator NlpD